jgi:predicted dehydrogenase
MVQEALRVAVIGFGWWGKIITQTLQEGPAVKVVMVVEPDAAVRALATEAAQRGGFAVADSIDAALANAQVEAVVLTTPHKFHAEQITAAANAGKHVFCEKPLCRTFAEAQSAIGACRKAGVVLGIGHERRFEPAVIELRRSVAAGELGSILQIEANFNQNKFFALPPDNWRLSKQHAPVGPLTGTGIHLVDLAIALMGPAESVWARLSTRGSKFENGDTLGIMLGFAGGASAMISAVLATPFDGRLAVYGSDGWTEIRDRTHPEHPTGWDVTQVARNGNRKSHFMPPFPAVRSNLEAFAAAVRGTTPYPVTQVEMLANVAALEAIMRSVDTGVIEKIAQPAFA